MIKLSANNMQQEIYKLLELISKEETEKIAREVGFVKRKGKLEAWRFLYQ